MKKSISIISIILLVLAITAVILVCFKKLETGFGISETLSIQTKKTFEGVITKVSSAKKTLWDWLQLLFVPLVLIFIGIIFNDIQKKRDQKIADLHEFQIWSNNMSDLILERDLLNSKEGEIVRDLAHTRTQTTLRVLDGERRGRVIRFLYNTGLIKKGTNMISTYHFDLYGANMIGFDFKDANLRNTYFDHSDFRGSIMNNVDFTNSTLKKAILRDTNLKTAILTGVNLEGAKYDYRTIWPENFDPKKYKAVNDDKLLHIVKQKIKQLRLHQKLK